jgi:hypothetical protein
MLIAPGYGMNDWSINDGRESDWLALSVKEIPI